MRTRITFGIIAAAALSLMGLAPSDATAQYRRPHNVAPYNQRVVMPSVQFYPQVQYPSIQATINNAYMNEWSQRAAWSYTPNPYYMMQPYIYSYGYSYGYNPYNVYPSVYPYPY
jgi:hypothetical protein